MAEAQIAIMLSVVMACLLGPIILLRGRAYIRGYRPRPDTQEYKQMLRHINYLNILGGGPVQTLILDSQWIIIGYIRFLIGLSLVIWVPIGIGLIVAYGSR